MSTFLSLMRSATCQSITYPIVLTMLGGPRFRPSVEPIQGKFSVLKIPFSLYVDKHGSALVCQELGKDIVVSESMKNL